MCYGAMAWAGISFTNGRSDFWNHFIEQIMHYIGDRSLVKLSTLGNFIKIQNTLGFQPRSAECVSNLFKVTSGWISLTNDLIICILVVNA